MTGTGVISIVGETDEVGMVGHGLGDIVENGAVSEIVVRNTRSAKGSTEKVVSDEAEVNGKMCS